jgi:hypothetical protein
VQWLRAPSRCADLEGLDGLDAADRVFEELQAGVSRLLAVAGLGQRRAALDRGEDRDRHHGRKRAQADGALAVSADQGGRRAERA